MSRQFQFRHGNFNSASRQFQFRHGNFNFITAISISPQQFQLRSRQFQLHHGNFNFVTAISTSSRQFQLCSRQFQIYHSNFNFVTAISKSSSLASLSLSLKSLTSFPGSLWPFKINDMAENLKYKFQSPRIICLPQNAKHSRT